MRTEAVIDGDTISYKSGNMRKARGITSEELSNMAKCLIPATKYFEKGIAKIVVEDGVIVELLPNKEKQQMLFKAIFDDMGEEQPSEEEE